MRDLYTLDLFKLLPTSAWISMLTRSNIVTDMSKVIEPQIIKDMHDDKNI